MRAWKKTRFSFHHCYFVFFLTSFSVACGHKYHFFSRMLKCQPRIKTRLAESFYEWKPFFVRSVLCGNALRYEWWESHMHRYLSWWNRNMKQVSMRHATLKKNKCIHNSTQRFVSFLVHSFIHPFTHSYGMIYTINTSYKAISPPTYTIRNHFHKSSGKLVQLIMMTNRGWRSARAREKTENGASPTH